MLALTHHVMPCRTVTLAVDFRSWSPDDVALGQAMAAEWKTLRDTFWSVAGTRVQHLLPPSYPPSYFPDYMPKLHNDVSGGAGWDAIQAVSLEAQESAVFVYRANLGADNMTIFPRGLSGDTLYYVASRDYGWKTNASGAKLMAQGLSVAMYVRALIVCSSACVRSLRAIASHALQAGVILGHHQLYRRERDVTCVYKFRVEERFF